MTFDLSANLELFWYWINERHRMYLLRKEGKQHPWSKDDILNTYRFCNVFRELDTVTIWIRENWREPYKDDRNLLFNMCVARQINWPETLQDIGYFAAGIKDWNPEFVRTIMLGRAARKQKVYTGAYMLTANFEDAKGKDKPFLTCYHVLLPVWKDYQKFLNFLDENDRPRLQDLQSMLTKYTGWGGFMAYEVVTDMRHTKYFKNAPDIFDWAHAGPGARRGLNRLAGRKIGNYGMPDDLCLKEMRYLLEISPKHLENHVPQLEMRDIEMSLCEFDKYMRVHNNEGRPRARYAPQPTTCN